MKQKVLGIGGLFFRSSDQKTLIEWYATHLGIDLSGNPMQQEAGVAVMSAMSGDSDYFDNAEQGWMLNLRVKNLSELMAELKNAGVKVETRPEWDGEYGKFARIRDPEDNPIELWQAPE